MKISYKRKATLFEITSFIVILGATFWQVFITDWYDAQLSEWQFYIQNEMLYSILWTMSDLSYQGVVDKEKAIEKLAEINKRTSEAVNKAIEQRDRREHIERGQAKIFFVIRSILFILGTILLIFGKWFELKSEK